MSKYTFDWSLLGDVNAGRPNLGTQVDVETYRLMQFTLRDALEAKLGADETDKIFYAAGMLAGAEFYKHYIHPVEDLNEFASKLQQALREKRIGVLRIEEENVQEGRVVLTIDEDLDCSGLPETDYEICVYDEGFISALFNSFTQETWQSKEIDCWCTGARTCRFLVTKTVAEPSV